MENTSTGPTSGSVLLQQSSLEESAVGGSTSESLPRASPIISPPPKTSGRNRSGNSKFNVFFKLNYQFYVRYDIVVLNNIYNNDFLLSLVYAPSYLLYVKQFLIKRK